MLRNNVVVATAGLPVRSIAVTSAVAGEGKTSVAVNLARALAIGGQRVVLVDLDLRNPAVHLRLGAHDEAGVTDALLDRRPLRDCLQYVEVGTGPLGGPRGMYVLPAGPAVDDPAELLATRRTARMLEALCTESDVCVCDTPPVLPVADTLQIARLVSGVILVVEPGRTATAAARRARDALARSQARLLGVVINKFEARRAPVDEAVAYGYGYVGDAP